MKRQRFDRLVQEALSRIPAEFEPYLDNVVVTVQDEPDPDQLIDPEEELLGLYLGVPLTERSVQDVFQMPDQVLIFQRPIEAICATDEEVVEEVRITVIHEVAHHFGLTDEEIEALIGP